MPTLLLADSFGFGSRKGDPHRVASSENRCSREKISSGKSFVFLIVFRLWISFCEENYFFSPLIHVLFEHFPRKHFFIGFPSSRWLLICAPCKFRHILLSFWEYDPFEPFLWLKIRFHGSNCVYSKIIFKLIYIVTWLDMWPKMINVFSWGQLLFSFVLIAQPIVAKLTRMCIVEKINRYAYYQISSPLLVYFSLK